MKNQWFIQVIESAKTESEAKEMLDGLKDQQGYKGGRLFFRDNQYFTQAFFEDDTDAIGMHGKWLPDGMRRVIVPLSARKRLGILED